MLLLLLFYGHICTRGKLDGTNDPKGNKMRHEIPRPLIMIFNNDIHILSILITLFPQTYM